MSERGWRDYTGGLTPLSRAALAIAFAAFICGFAAPYLLPFLSEVPIVSIVTIVECNDLPQPLGGNNRSILGIDSNPDALNLGVRLNKDTYAVGEALEIEVVFRNGDNGPIVLHFNRDTPPPISDKSAAGYSGLMFEIERIGGVLLIDQNNYPVPGTFASTTLRLLGSRARCTQTYTLDGTRLQTAQMGPGEYRIRAIYNNATPGIRPPDELNPPLPTPTPFPEYRADQNVWVGRGTSNEVRFTITDQIALPAQ